MGNCKTCGQSILFPVATPYVPTGLENRCSSCHNPQNSCSCERFCQEDHTTSINYKTFGYTVRIKDGFVWPSKDNSVVLNVEGVDRISAGTLIWNPAAGYLQVQSFSYANQQITAKNTGISCNTYQGGETLPELTDFVVGPPVCPGSSTPLPNTPYLAADFTAPANGNCQVTALTNVAGLAPNDVISLNNYQYRVGSVIDGETASLCNDGEGAAVGTVLRWDTNNDGVPDTPVIKISSENPCTRGAIAAGVLLVCDGSDLAKPLNGSIDGQIPIWNDAAQRFELRTFPSEFNNCSALSVALTLDPGHVGSYAVVVLDTSPFAHTIVELNGLQYIVNTIDSPTTMHITPVVPPLSVNTVAASTPICINPDPTAGANCSILTAGFTAGVSVGPYTLNFSTTVNFHVGQILQMAGIQWVVISITDAYTASLSEVVALGGPVVIPSGTYCCIAFAGEQQTVVAPGTVIATNSTYATPVHTYFFRNPSPNRPLHVCIRTDFFFDFVNNAPNTIINPAIQDNINSAGYNTVASYTQVVSIDSTLLPVNVPFERLLHLPGGAAADYLVKGIITNPNAGSHAADMDQITLKTTFKILQP